MLGTVLRLVGAISSGRLVGVTYLTSGSGTYNKPAGVNALFVIAVGGGASGAGIAGGASGRGCSGGGGAGGYSEYYTDAPASSYSYSVGAAGTAPSAGSNAGNNGGNTTFGGITCNGGTGGIVGAAFGTAASIGSTVAGGTASGGDININGQRGDAPIRLNSTEAKGGNGGSTPLGAGGIGAATEGQGGIAASGYGAGGAGAKAASSTDRAGGAGAPGIIIIFEFSS